MIRWISEKNVYVALSTVEVEQIASMVQQGEVKLQYISTDEQIAEILTKPLSKVQFVYFRDKFGVMENVSLNERECW